MFTNLTTFKRNALQRHTETLHIQHNRSFWGTLKLINMIVISKRLALAGVQTIHPIILESHHCQLISNIIEVDVFIRFRVCWKIPCCYMRLAVFYLVFCFFSPNAAYVNVIMFPSIACVHLFAGIPLHSKIQI